MAVRIQMRRGTSSDWSSANPILNEGEVGYNTSTGQFKIGDGTSAFTSLTYFTAGGDISNVIAGVGLLGGGTSGEVTLSADTTVVATTNNTLTMSSKTFSSPIVSGLYLSDSSIVFEGSSVDENETTLTITNPTADRTITLPDVTGTVVTTGDVGTVTSTMIADGTIVNADINASAAIDKTKISGTAITAADTGTVTSTMIADGTIVNADINASAAIDKTKISGTAITAADTGTVTNAMLAGSIANDKLSNSTISGVALGSNLNALTISTGLSGTSYNGSSAVTIAIDSTVATTSGTQTLTNKTLGAGTALSADLSAATYKITGLGTPSASTDAATKQYVDDVAQGLHIHASCVTATTNNIDLSTDLEAGDVIDGVTLVAGDRVLVKNQSTTSQNGIYLAVTSGAAVRASDFDSASEIQGGDFVFITGGTVNDSTGWVQTEKVTTVGTDPIVFSQFSGAGTYLAGTGLTLTGNTFSINTGTTVDLNTAQTLTNKTISGTSNTITNVSLTSGVTGTLPVENGGTGITSFGTGISTFLGTPSSANLLAAVTDETGSGSLVFATSPTLTTPNIGVATGTSFNSITGLSSTTPLAGGTAAVGTETTVARADHVHPVSALTISTGLSGTSYNGSSAVTIAIDSTVATLTGSQTLSNKTLTSPVISSISNTGTLTLPISTDTLVGRATTDTLTNKTLSAAILSGTLTAGGGTGSSGQVLQSTGSGVQWVTATAGADEIMVIMGAY